MGRGTPLALPALFMSALLFDLRSAVRSALRSPASTVVVVTTLAVAIGANTLAFSLVHGILLRPLPYPEPERLVRLWETAPAGPDELRSIAHPTLAEWQRGLRSFESIALFGPWSFDLAGEGRPEQVPGATVSGDYFRTLGVEPALGRTFVDAELRPGGPRAVLLGDGLWRRRFGADPGVLGRTLVLSGQPYAVVGVLPPGFEYPKGAELYASTAIDPEHDAAAARHLSAVARLREGVTHARASGELAAMARTLAARLPETHRGHGLRLVPMREWIVGDARPALLVLTGVVGAVLLLACANVANLMLHRTLRREREIAVRTALGASGWRVVRLLLVESLGVATLGAALGVAIATGGLRLVRVFAADRFPRLDEVALDSQVLLFTAGLAALSGLLAGLLPALHAVSSQMRALVASGGRTASAGVSRMRLRGALVVAQTSIAVALLVVAGLLLRTLWGLASVEPGLSTERALVFEVALPPAQQEDAPFVVEFFDRLRERLAAVPGVSGVALASRLPLSGEDHSSSFRFPSEPEEAALARSAQDRAVTPGYFRTLGVPVRGREFADSDRSGAPAVALVNESFARRFFPGRDALGEWFVPARAGGVARRIVGVAGDTRQAGLDVPVEPEYYLPHAQDPWPFLHVVVRTSGPPRSLLPALERAVWSLAPDMPLTEVSTLEDMEGATLSGRRWNAALLLSFAGLALGLATLGTYSVMATLVRERRREMGVRLALGARPAELQRATLGSGLRLAGLGAAIGALFAAGASRAVSSLLFGVSALDPATFAAVVAFVVAAVGLASLLPARRAAAVDPLVVLRD